MKNKVVLKKLQKEDAKALAHHANNKKIADNLRDVFPHPYTLADAEWFINFNENDSKDHRWAIEYDGNFCGLIGLHVKGDVYSHNLELGYWLGEKYWGKGIMTTAIKLVIQKGFSELKCHRIYTSVFAYNVGSAKVLEKSGFIKEGRLKESIFKNGKFHDEIRYGILERDVKK